MNLILVSHLIEEHGVEPNRIGDTNIVDLFQVAVQHTDIKINVVTNNNAVTDKLEKFREKSCYFVNVVKCRAERYNKKNLINRTVKNCSVFLDREIKDLNPHTIVVLGERALYGLKCCDPFKESISTNSINTLLEETKKQPLRIKDSKLYFLPLPIWRNRQYLDSIQLIFKFVKKEIQK